MLPIWPEAILPCREDSMLIESAISSSSFGSGNAHAWPLVGCEALGLMPVARGCGAIAGARFGAVPPLVSGRRGIGPEDLGGSGGGIPGFEVGACWWKLEASDASDARWDGLALSCGDAGLLMFKL